METRTLHVACNTRPARLAFLINTPEPGVLEEVFRLNTLLWGGMFNPVVVMDGTSRQRVGRHYMFEDETYEREVVHLLEEFDPDFLIDYSGVQITPALNRFRILPRQRLRWNPWGREEIYYFLEAWPFLFDYWSREFRSLQKPPHKFAYIDFASAGKLRTYLAARFGGYPEEHAGNKWLANNCSANAAVYDDAFRKSFRTNEWVFPIGISTLRIESRLPNRLGGYCFFLFDPADMFDVVDYWNLRAAGFHIFPLPIDHYQDFSESAKAFAEISKYWINSRIENWVEIIKGGSMDDAELDKAGEWLRTVGIQADRLSLQGWVPRFGSRHYRVSPEIEIQPVVSSENDEIVVVTDSYGTLKLPRPECKLDGIALSQHWVTDLRFFGASDSRHTFRAPWLHPGCDEVVGFRIGHGFDAEASRVSKRGIVAICSGDKGNLSLEEPKVIDVFRAYLKDGRFEYRETSSAGLALERILDQLGGFFHCRVFQNAGVRELIENLSGGSHMHADEIRRTIYKAIDGDKHKRQNECQWILKTLFGAKVLRQGLRLQCERCQRHDWYHLSEVGEEFKCRKCFHVEPVPLLDKFPWHCVSDGLFRLEGKVAGSLTSILSLAFLESYLEQHGLRYVPSFNYADASGSAERDFAVLSSGFFDEDVEVIIGECKTAKGLDEKQKKDINALGERTRAFLAFSTLSSDFTGEDKKFFEELVIAHLNPILLTRKQLEMPSIEVSRYRMSARGLGRSADVLSRQTVTEILGHEFAERHDRLP